MKPTETNIRTKYARPYIPNAVFYIPFAYYYAVRLGTIPKLLSWALIYLMPTAFYSAVGYNGSWGLFALNYFLILLATFSLYEYGYIYNDTMAIRREKEPAIRLYEENFAHFARWHQWIVFVRLFISIAALGVLFMLNNSNPHVQRVFAAVAVTGLFFAIYNQWRSRTNVWFYPLLVCSRYAPFMVLYDGSWTAYILLLVSFPLLNALERFSMPKYRWPLMRSLIPEESAKTRFRVYYYALTLVLATAFLYSRNESLLLLTPIFILFLYRLCLLFWLRTHKPTNYLNG